MCVGEGYIKLEWKNIFSIESLPLFIMKRIIFPLWLHHHISVNNNHHADINLFFTMYPTGKVAKN